jgi:hypothetical protein
MTDVDIDRPAVQGVTAAVASAATDLDAAGPKAPGAVDAGLASDVVSGILSTFAGCGARLVTASTSLASTAGTCNERFLLAGGAIHAP